MSDAVAETGAPSGADGMSKSRVETFSDGVFAIAITLLVLTISQPTDYRDLAHQLAHRWPSLAAYVVSFAIIGIMWVNHHTVFNNLERIDRGLFYRNLVLLMTIVFIPYPTGVFGEALRLGHGARTAAVFYSVTMAVNGYAWTAMWLWASLGRRLLRSDFPEDQRTRATVGFSAGVIVYTATVGVAFVNAYACLAVHGALAVYYAFDPLSRQWGRRQAAAGAEGPAGQ
jgi:uncharacterized membrane protein